MIIHKLRKLPLFLLSFMLFISCREDDADLAEEKVPYTLIEHERFGSASANTLQRIFGAVQLELPLQKLQYDVDYYRLEYETMYNGEIIEASGIIMIPETDKPVSLLSYHHGTIASEQRAPSQLSSSSYSLLLYQGIASAGFVVVVPDYIGFGSSKEFMHPYYVEDLSASAVRDNLFAAQNLTEELGINLTGRLYLAGYSQGGYVTMATQKSIEQEPIIQLQLQTSFAAAGGYDVSGMQDYFFTQEVYDQPFFMAYVAYAYDQTYDMETEMDDYFNEPYASEIPTYFSGAYSGEAINSLLNDTIQVLVDTEYLANPDAGIYTPMSEALAANSLLDWTPEHKIILYHGDEDTWIPFQNSVNTYETLKAQSSAEIELVTLAGADHLTGFGPFLEALIAELVSEEEL